MKKVILFLVFLSATINLKSQLKSEVNECFELASIVFRLADAKEYVNNQLSDYTNQIDSYFTEYKDHKLIIYVKEIREKQAIGYDAVPTAAFFLTIKDGEIIIRPDLKASQISSIDSRWTEESFKTFVSLLNDFYKKAKFNKFFTQQTDLYKLAEERMDKLLGNFNIDWFSTIFPEDILPPMVVVSPSNGPNNYAFSIPVKDKINGMVIGCGVDENDQPAFSQYAMFLITHEFSHNYTNPRIADNWSKIDSASQIIYSVVKEDMHKNAYAGAQTTMMEWFDNLVTLMYLQDNPTKDFHLGYAIRDNQERGFIWMDRSVTFMEHFRNNRNIYASIDDFMPQVVGFINNTADNFDEVLNEFNNRHPYIKDIFPVPNHCCPIKKVAS